MCALTLCAGTSTATGEDEWAHSSITLHPLNAEFQPLELRGADFRVIAEWLQVLE